MLGLILAQTVNQDTPPFYEINIVFGKIVSTLLALAGIVLFIVLILGGIKWLTAGGDPKAVESAQKTLTYGIVGLIFIALAYLILVLISDFTGVTGILNFNIFFIP